MVSKLDFSLFYHTIPSLIQTKPDACVNVFPTCYPWKVNRRKDKMHPFQGSKKFSPRIHGSSPCFVLCPVFFTRRLQQILTTRYTNMYLRWIKLSLTNRCKIGTINSTGNLSKRSQSPPSHLHINIAVLLAREHPVWL